MKNAFETGFKPHFSKLADEIQREQSQLRGDFFFDSHWVLYKLHESRKIDLLSLILVLRVPCPAVFCVVAATCEKLHSQFPHM